MNQLTIKDIARIKKAIESAKSSESAKSQKKSTMPEKAFRDLSRMLTTAVVNGIGSKSREVRDGAREISDLWLGLNENQRKLAIEKIVEE